MSYFQLMPSAGHVAGPARDGWNHWLVAAFIYAMGQLLYEPLTYKAFADLGIDQLAYVRRVGAEEAKNLFQVDVAPEIELFSVHSADGRPIMLTATLEAAMTSARVNNLHPVMIQ